MKIILRELMKIIDFYQYVDISDTQGRPLFMGDTARFENELHEELLDEEITNIQSSKLLDREVINIKAFEGHLDIIVSKIEEVTS